MKSTGIMKKMTTRSKLAVFILAFCFAAQSGWGLTVEVAGPVGGADYSEFRLSFINDSEVAFAEQESEWIYRMAELLYAEPKNRSSYDSPAELTLSWKVGIAPDSPLSRGWYVSRGPDAVFVRQGPVGGDSWKGPSADRLILSVLVPSTQLPEAFGWDAIEVFARHLARDVSGNPSETSTLVLGFPSAPRQPRLQLLEVGSQGSGLRLRAEAEPGFGYQLERSTDLRSWAPVGEWKASPAGELVWQMEQESGPSAFYRLRVRPEF